MKKKAPKQGRWRKILATGRFSLFQGVHMETIFEVSWKKAGGSYGRRRFNAESVERAVARAPIVAGLDPDTPSVEGVTILEGFNLALAESRRGEAARRLWIYQQTRFIGWIVDHHPEISHWHQVTRRVIKDYLASFASRSDNHKRLMLQPIVQTAGWLEREYQLPNVTGRLGISNAIKRPTPAVFLADVLALLDYLKQHHPELEAGAALQGLAALRVLETLRLTWGKVDLERGLIEVGSPGVNPLDQAEAVPAKTDWSHRTIPVCARVLEALQRAWERRPNPQVIDLEAPVIPTLTGISYLRGTDSFKNYTTLFRAALKAWNPQAGWQVKDLRNAVPTALAMAGLKSDASEQYMGHAPQGVTARHYIPRLAAVTPGEAAAFAEAMQMFRALVVDQIELLIRQAREKHEAKILNNFEQDQEPESPEEGISQVN